MRVVIASQYYRPEPVPIPGDVADWLAAQGHEVVVITGYPNYPSGRVDEKYDARRRTTEMDGSIVVHRIPMFASHSLNPASRIRNYLSYAGSARRSRHLVAEADVVYVYASQMTAAVGPAAWRARGGPPFVLHIQDLWPDSVTATTLLPRAVGHVAARLLNPWIQRTYRATAHVIATSPGMAELLEARGVPRRKIEVVMNWATPERPVRAATTTGGSLRLVYAGNIGAAQDLATVLAAMDRIRDLDVTLDVYGTGVGERELRRQLDAAALPSVQLHGRVDPDGMSAHYAAADFQLVTLRDESVFRSTIPSKLAAGFAEGVPAITNVAGDVADLVTANGVGFACVPGDAEALADAIRIAAGTPRKVRAAMRVKARALYTERMSRAAGLTRITEILDDVAGGR